MKLILPVSDFNLEHTLECGQAFRWAKTDGFYYGIIAERLLRIKYDGRRLICESDSPLNKEEVLEYFGLNEDLSCILREIDVDKRIHKAVLKFRGLRILNQGHWECLASFILSSYNNIPRIKKMIGKLSENFGKRLTLGQVEGYSFPAAAKIAKVKVSDLRRLGLGFRAGYLKDAACKIASGRLDLNGLEDLNYEEAKKSLISLKGVGEKVADCALLFSFKKYEAFPVDVWIKRGIEDLYFKGRAVPQKKIAEFARSHFGRYAGYAQEYLYHYLRRGR
ncbi:MAG: DNA glycosylase [Candidatus Omnitrophota bacterium]|nr:DNA glycosylase [Candidatus Omnitrophota bacterium]